MARIVRIFKTLRNNWKKTTLGVILVTYGVNYGVKKYRTNEMLKLYCEEAKAFGDAPLPIGVPVRQITVVLNPASNDGKGKAEFEEYCAPLLYLSGMKVSVVKTESIGEARGLIDVMDNCDAVVVAGGDGALTEAVTGLLRRNDSEFAVQRLPIGIIPVGKLNNIAKSIFKEYKDDRIKLMAEATMAIIRDYKKHVDVMKVEVLEEGENIAGKPIYALGELRWGAFRDVDERIGKYWLWGPLKPYAAYLLGAFKSLTWECDSQFQYTVPCDGCRNCMQCNAMQGATQPRYGSPAQNARWWHAFIPLAKSVKETKQNKDYSSIINLECGVWHQKDFSAVEFQTLTENNLAFTLPNKPKHLEVNLGPNNLGKFDFMKEGWLRAKTGVNHIHREKIPVRQFKMVPKTEEKPASESVKVEEGKAPDVERWYSIDNDNYEVKPIRVTLLPDAIKVFSASTSR